jgi:hypothetical protein
MPPRLGETGETDRGQATAEYVGVVLLVAVLVGALAVAVGPSLPGGGLARAVAERLLCAVGSSPVCDRGPAERPTALEAAYGSEVAALLARNAPDLYFEGDDFASLPVDFRDCRSRSCADTIRRGAVRATQTGLPPTAFTHVVDCRRRSGGLAAARSGDDEADCSGPRAGKVYLQYWLYYPDSLTHGLGRVGGYHLDDWESFQTRIDSGGSSVSRASSHHGYNGRAGGIGSIGSDTGWSPRSAWEPGTRALHIAAGSHAGTTQPALGDDRAIHREDLVLVPAEPIAAASTPDFAISPPWEKNVWRDPESTGT